MIFNLRTVPEEGAGFAMRLQAWLEEWSGLTGIAVDWLVEPAEENVPPSAEVALFSIVREAFTNIRKHSNATKLGSSLPGRRTASGGGCGSPITASASTCRTVWP